MLTINNMEVKYGSQTALTIESPITFQKGDRIGIIGSNGAGKSTFIKAVLGLIDYEGSIHSDLKPEQIAVHMQFNNYTNTMSVKHIMEAVLNTNVKKNEKLQELITFFDFENCLSKKFSALSGGQQQRMTIILVLMQESELVFFDEVTSGLDFETRQRLMDKLIAWYKEHPSTLCVVSHYYEELEQLVNKVIILEEGHVVDFGDKDELFRKYCGNVIISLENNEKNRVVTKSYELLEAPNHMLVVSCKDDKEELELTKTLIQENVNFKRSNSDMEILYINAKNAYRQKAQKKGDTAYEQ